MVLSVDCCVNIYLSLCLSLCLTVCPSVCLSACVSPSLCARAHTESEREREREREEREREMKREERGMRERERESKSNRKELIRFLEVGRDLQIFRAAGLKVPDCCGISDKTTNKARMRIKTRIRIKHNHLSSFTTTDKRFEAGAVGRPVDRTSNTK